MKDSSQTFSNSLGSPATEDWWNTEAGREILILEDSTVRAVFDGQTGAWLDFQHKPTGWKIQRRPELGQSFRAYATWKDRLFNPVSGLSCELRSAVVGAPSQEISFHWDFLRTARGVKLPISLVTHVRLERGQLIFSGTMTNGSDATITTLSW